MQEEPSSPRAKFPDLPWSSIEKGTFVPLRTNDVSSRAQVEGLIIQMFDEPETSFFLYLAKGEYSPPAMRHAEERHEVQMRLVKRPFYLHKAGDGHSFSKIKEASPDGVEYTQLTLCLTEKTKRELTIRQHIQAEQARKPADPIVALKPSILGFSIDLKALWKRIVSRR